MGWIKALVKLVMQLRLLSWNIWGGKHIDEIVDFIGAYRPNIIALQEVVENGDSNTAAEIADQLNYNFAYFQAIGKNGNDLAQGNAILTSFPIEESKSHFLSDISLYKGTAETEPRIAVEVKIRIDNKLLSIFSVHLAYSHKFQNSKMRDLQVDNLIKLIPSSYAILLGDFNSHPDSTYMERLIKVMKNADSVLTEPTWTVYPFDYEGFQETELRHRLDYIFTSKDIAVERFFIPFSKGSDHLPVSAIVII